MEKVRIDKLQYVLLIPNLIFAKAIGFTTGIFARKVGIDTLISMFIGFIFGTIVIVLTTYLSSKYLDRTLLEYSKVILGNWLGKMLGWILVLFFGIAFITSANTLTIHLQQYMLPETPFILLCFLYVLLNTYAVYLGIEVIIRFSFFALIAVSILNITMIFGTIGAFKMENLMPFLDKGISRNIVTSFYLFSDLSMASLAIPIIFPMLNDQKKPIKLSLWAMVLSLFAVLPWPIMELGTLGPDIMKTYVVVCMEQARSAQLTVYLPRYEMVMISLFTWSAFTQSAVMLYCTVYSFKETIGGKDNTRYIVYFSILLFLGTYFLGYDQNKFVLFLTSPWSWMTAILAIALPISLLVLGKLKRKI